MFRFAAGAAAAFLLLTGAFLFWQSHAEQAPRLPDAPPPRLANVSLPVMRTGTLQAPEASPRSREERRFSRADKNKDGRIEAEELLGPRRKAFAKLDTDGNGALSFAEWAHTTFAKFAGADKDRSRFLTPAEYATTAPPPPKRKTCSCGSNPIARNDSED